jgi:hypothetical protein
MNAEISPPKTDLRDDEDRDYGRRTVLPQKLAAPTTHKRVGRSMRLPPRPSVDDGPGDSAVSTEEIPEDVGTALLGSLRDVLKTRKGIDDLGSSLDGRPAEDRSPEEILRLTRTFVQLRQDGTVNVQAFAVGRGRVRRLLFADGQEREVTLGARQRSLWCGSGQQTVIVVAADLSPEIRVEEILAILADEIETVAMENHVIIRRGGVLGFLRGVAMRLCNHRR